MTLPRVDPATAAELLARQLLAGQPVELAGGLCESDSHVLSRHLEGVVAERALSAIQLCRRCPVLAECAVYAEGLPARHRKHVVLAGVVHGDTGRAIPLDLVERATRRAA